MPGGCAGPGGCGGGGLVPGGGAGFPVHPRPCVPAGLPGAGTPSWGGRWKNKAVPALVPPEALVLPPEKGFHIKPLSVWFTKQTLLSFV